MLKKPKKRKSTKQTKSQKQALYQECIRDMPQCMMPQCGSHYWNAIHHIRFGSCGRKTYKGNLIVLCKNCHDLSHSDQKKYTPILIEVVNAFYSIEN
jgi:hypothetical protein